MWCRKCFNTIIHNYSVTNFTQQYVHWKFHQPRLPMYLISCPQEQLRNVYTRGGSRLWQRGGGVRVDTACKIFGPRPPPLKLCPQTLENGDDSWTGLLAFLLSLLDGCYLLSQLSKGGSKGCYLCTLCVFSLSKRGDQLTPPPPPWICAWEMAFIAIWLHFTCKDHYMRCRAEFLKFYPRAHWIYC